MDPNLCIQSEQSNSLNFIDLSTQVVNLKYKKNNSQFVVSNSSAEDGLESSPSNPLWNIYIF